MNSSIKRMGRDDDDDDRREGAKPKTGMSTVAIVGIVIGVLFLSCCMCCGGWTALNWTEFKKGFDEGFDKAQKQQKQK